MTAKLDKKTGFLILGAVVALALIVILYAYFASLPAPSPSGGGQAAGPSGPAPVYAAAGQLVAGFPSTLILDNAAKVSESYSIGYSASLNQYTAQWNSSSSMASLDILYQNYLSKNGWRITKQSTNRPAFSPEFRGIYATNGSYDANVTIVAEGTGAEVTITYLAK